MPYLRLEYTKPTNKRLIITKKRSIINKIIAWERGKEYYDGKRINGYGGFKYDGRWKKILPKFIKKYNLNSKSKVLDVGCKKGFLLKDLKDLVPGIKIFGIEDHKYPIQNSIKEVRTNLKFADYYKIPYKKNYFDAVFAFHCIYRANFGDTVNTIKEIERVSKKNSYITLGAFNDKKGKELYDQWGILSTSHQYIKDWKKILKHINYKGDYSFTTPESLGLKKKSKK
jgi:ubiquinone/menaquinone biosynthesis C-methylase UbiE